MSELRRYRIKTKDMTVISLLNIPARISIGRSIAKKQMKYGTKDFPYKKKIRLETQYNSVIRTNLSLQPIKMHFVRNRLYMIKLNIKKYLKKYKNIKNAN